MNNKRKMKKIKDFLISEHKFSLQRQKMEGIEKDEQSRIGKRVSWE
jgi:hypothetical protein